MRPATTSRVPSTQTQSFAARRSRTTSPRCSRHARDARRARMTAFTVSAPASSANLGAGFDAVGIAIEIRMTARVRELPPGSATHWSYAGRHAPTHDGLRGCVEAAIARVAPDAPSLAIELD